jgi:hypothetical protein
MKLSLLINGQRNFTGGKIHAIGNVSLRRCIYEGGRDP